MCPSVVCSPNYIVYWTVASGKGRGGWLWHDCHKSPKPHCCAVGHSIAKCPPFFWEDPKYRIDEIASLFLFKHTAPHTTTYFLFNIFDKIYQTGLVVKKSASAVWMHISNWGLWVKAKSDGRKWWMEVIRYSENRNRWLGVMKAIDWFIFVSTTSSFRRAA